MPNADAHEAYEAAATAADWQFDFLNANAVAPLTAVVAPATPTGTAETVSPYISSTEMIDFSSKVRGHCFCC
jgi:hypothetical protein